MEEELSTSQDHNPLDHSLEAVLPGVHERMASTQSEVASIKRKIDAIDMNGLRNDLMDHFTSSVAAMMKRMDERESALADHFESLAEGIRRGRNVRRKVVNDGQQESKEDLEEKQEQEADPHDIPSSHHIQYKHATLLSIHDEWFGEGIYKNVPVPGGLEALELSHKSKWRKHFSGSQDKAFSRLKRIVRALKDESNCSGHTIIEVCERWNSIYSTECKKSLSKMEDWLKTSGRLPKAAPRGKTAK